MFVMLSESNSIPRKDILCMGESLLFSPVIERVENAILKYRNGLGWGRIEKWKYASFRSVTANQSTNLGVECIWKCFSVSTFWTGARPNSKHTDLRSVVTHHLSWVQSSMGCKTPPSQSDGARKHLGLLEKF